MTVVEIFEALEATSGSLAKREILELNVKNELLKRAFVATFDPYTVYYVSKFKMPASVRPNDEPLDDRLRVFLDILETQLATRNTTGNAARALVETQMHSLTNLEQKWCLRILLKNLRCGVQESSINKVWPGIVTSFAVALACTLKSEFIKGEGIKILEPVSYPVRVEPKLDGLRCIAVKKDGAVTFFTRNGTVLESMPKIKAALEAADYDDLVLDGEAMAKDWNESASVVMSKTQKDDSNLVYNVFDAMTLHDWVAQECGTEYVDRAEVVRLVVEAANSKHVAQVPHIMALSEPVLKAFFAKCMDEGFEGVMLKTLDTGYTFKRSENILKLKPCVTYEGVVVGHYEGRTNTRREGQFGGFYVLLPNQIITRCGGGFNDILRAQIQLEGYETWNGKIAECEAQPDPLTADGLTSKGKMRFPVYTRCRDASDVDPKVPATYVWWTNLDEQDRQTRITAVARGVGDE